jgi:glyoxylase-like metal-dependent hydrolase (beta-lactamase superfamily II)
MEENKRKGTMETSSVSERAFMNLLAGLQHITDPTETLEQVAPDIAYMRLLLVNVVFIGHAGPRRWALVDAGLPGSANSIIRAAEKLYGPGAYPSSIILTHGHFDHVGAANDLLEHWDVPVYAHEAEIPYLTGEDKYAEPDPRASKGIMAKLSPLYPREPINLDDRIRRLPEEASVPGIPEWRWIHTPGHTPGHVALFRDSDRTVIVGDAFTTVDQESARDFIAQEMEVHGPPKYFTPDWYEAGKSVKLIHELHPRLAVPAHGPVIRDEELEQQLGKLVDRFDEIAIPEEGMYVP